jgi:hypothetical protein
MPTAARKLVTRYRKILDNPKASPGLQFKVLETLRELQGLTAKQQSTEEMLPSEALQHLMREPD